MSREIYASLSGARAAWSQIEVVANNLANASTTGFRAAELRTRSSGPGSHPLGEAYAELESQALDLRDGAVAPDGVETHLALSGAGWFVVGVGGDEALTRDGRFRLDGDRRLVDVAGRPVRGMGGDIVLPEGEPLRVSPDGAILGRDGAELDRLWVAAGPVRPVGGNRYVPDGPLVPVERPRVVQGALEGSNVDPLAAMTDLILASRSFEAYQKAMQASDELDQRLGRIGTT